MPSKTKALDALHSQNSHILRFSWTGEPELTVQHIQESFRILTEEGTLTVKQIDALSELIYYSYLLGTEKK